MDRWETEEEKQGSGRQLSHNYWRPGRRPGSRATFLLPPTTRKYISQTRTVNLESIALTGSVSWLTTLFSRSLGDPQHHRGIEGPIKLQLDNNSSYPHTFSFTEQCNRNTSYKSAANGISEASNCGPWCVYWLLTIYLCLSTRTRFVLLALYRRILCKIMTTFLTLTCNLKLFIRTSDMNYDYYHG